MMTRRALSRWIGWPFRAISLGIVVLLVACGTSQAPTPSPQAECPECPENTCPEPVRYEDLWTSSPHADGKAEAFVHWDEDDPPEIPVECAKCHSRPGFVDFLGVDGTEAGKVDNPVKVGTTVTCFVCHNEAIADLDSAVFPSGVKVRGLGAEAPCIQCHQGRASTVTVDDAIAEAGLAGDDTSSEALGFVNSHATSAATPFGAEVQGAYECAGETYRGRYVRGGDFFACVRCHDEHTLALKFETCGECHTIAGTEARDIRVDTTDYDGDGDMQEGIAYEIEAIQEGLLTAIQAYASDTVGTPIVYDPHAYPYFFVDTDGNGQVDPDEAIFPNRYNGWTPRLLKAAYNYNYVWHDPGAYAHNSDYVIQVLYDSLADLGADTSGLTRPIAGE